MRYETVRSYAGGGRELIISGLCNDEADVVGEAVRTALMSVRGEIGMSEPNLHPDATSALRHRADRHVFIGRGFSRFRARSERGASDSSKCILDSYRAVSTPIKSPRTGAAMKRRDQSGTVEWA